MKFEMWTRGNCETIDVPLRWDSLVRLYASRAEIDALRRALGTVTPEPEYRLTISAIVDPDASAGAQDARCAYCGSSEGDPHDQDYPHPRHPAEVSTP